MPSEAPPAPAAARVGGRGHTKKQEAALALRQDPKRSVKEICEMLHFSQATFYRYVKASDPAGERPLSVRFRSDERQTPNYVSVNLEEEAK